MNKTANQTNFDSVKLLCQSILRHLESKQMIAVKKELRHELLERVATQIHPQVRTQEDMENEVLQSIGEKTEELDELRLSGGEAYRTVRQSWLSKHGEYEVDGLYFQQPIKYVAQWFIQYLFKDETVDEVFSEDEELAKVIVATIGSFRRSKLN